MRYQNHLEFLLQKMYAAVNDGTAKVLTVEAAKELKGKRIQTIYFGYRGQDGVDDFIINDFKTMYELHHDRQYLDTLGERTVNQFKNIIEIVSERGNTAIRYDKDYSYIFDEPTFTCSDVDRGVFFIEAETKGTEECLIPFFERVSKEFSYPFMAGKIYEPDNNEEKVITQLLSDLSICNPYPSDYHYNELRHRMWLWECVNTTNRLIADGKVVDPQVNPIEWRMWP